jgi:hypothetical protein
MARAKAEGLAEKVQSGEISYEKGLDRLAKAQRHVGRYKTAIEILRDDMPYWDSIGKVVGSGSIDEYMFRYVHGPVDGAYDFASSFDKWQKEAVGENVGSTELMANKARNPAKAAVVINDN